MIQATEASAPDACKATQCIATRYTPECGVKIGHFGPKHWQHVDTNEGRAAQVGPIYRTRAEAFSDHHPYLRRAGWLKEEAGEDSSSAPIITPTTVHIEAYACDENGDGPTHAAIHVTTAFVARLIHLSKLCLVHHLSEVREFNAPDWAFEGALEGEELVVNRNDFWFVAHPRHQDYHVETRMQSIAAFIDAVQSGQKAFGSYSAEEWTEILEGATEPA